jgi:hypothetical protein
LSLQLILLTRFCWYRSHLPIQYNWKVLSKCNPLIFKEKKLQVTLGKLTKDKFVSPILLCHNFAYITVILLYTDVCMRESVLFYYRVVRIVYFFWELSQFLKFLPLQTLSQTNCDTVQYVPVLNRAKQFCYICENAPQKLAFVLIIRKTCFK